MVLLLTGASHTGKTVLAQKLLEKYGYPYFSLDLLKMGLIRSGHTSLTPEDDMEMTAYLWPIVREMIKTAIENRLHLVVEGCYIPFDWEKDFDESYRKEIQYRCLVMTEAYINNHFEDIRAFASIIEKREDTGCTKEWLLAENAYRLEQCRKYGCPMILIDETYQVDVVL